MTNSSFDTESYKRSQSSLCTTAGKPVWLRRGLITAAGAAVVLFSTAALSQTGDGGETAIPPTYPYIFIATADGSEVRPLVKGLGPSWSSYGERLSFYRESESIRGGTVYVIDEGAFYGYPVGSGIEPAWGPDGSKLVYTSSEGIARREDPQYALVNTLIRHDFLIGTAYSEGGTDPASDQGVGKAAWSPDGTRVAFEHLGDGDLAPAQIYLMNEWGGEVQRLNPSSGVRYAESDPAWSPDGSSIAFWSYGYGLAVVDLATRNVRTLYKDFPRVAYGASPAWSPDGSTIAFVVRKESYAEPAIWLIDSGGGNLREFIPDAYDPAWSPDGSQLAFVSDLPGPEPQPVFAAVPDALSVYTRVTPHVAPVDSTSRFVLFADGKFELQYAFADKEGYSFAGSYVRTELDISFDFDANWDWQVTGVFDASGKAFSLAHSITMILDGFEDGVYQLDGQEPEEPTDPEGPVKEPDEPFDPPVVPPLDLLCPLDCLSVDDKEKPFTRKRN